MLPGLAWSMPIIMASVVKMTSGGNALQLSLYSLMLEETHGVRCQGGLFLMRMHAAYETYEVVSCRDMRDEARAVLEVEGQRILAERHKLSG